MDKGTFFCTKVVLFPKITLLTLSSTLSSQLQEIAKGSHDDKRCEKYYNEYKKQFGQGLPACQFTGNKSKIQKLIRKVRIDAYGRATEVPFGKEEMCLIS